MFVLDLVTIREISQEISCRQAHHLGTRLSVQVPKDLEDQRSSTPFSIASKRFPRHIFVPNLMTLGEIFTRHGADKAILGVFIS